MEHDFTVLENKMVGRKKAQEVADHIGISESAYTKYERVESKITIDIIQKVAEFHKVDPMQLLIPQSGHFVDNGNNSPFAIHGNVHTVDENLTALITKLIENQLAMNEKIMLLLGK